MESITIIPKDVSVAWMPELNEFKISINKETMIEKESNNLLIEKLYDELSNYDIVECNEINPSSDCNWFVIGSAIYNLNGKNISELKKDGETIISYHGRLKDNIDLNVESDKNFIIWYYSVDTLEEAIELLN